MKALIRICIIAMMVLTTKVSLGQQVERSIYVDFYGGNVQFTLNPGVDVRLSAHPDAKELRAFYYQLSKADCQSLIDTLLSYRREKDLNDWLYYQLVRKTAEQISPKAENYARYTAYKWFLMCKSGYDARLALTSSEIIFYIYNKEDIEDIPFFMVDGKKFMCLNIHDYPKANLEHDPAIPVSIKVEGARNAFSYRVTKLPDFRPESYTSKNIQFSYKQKAYHFEVKLNPDVESIFKNYPVVDFADYFNIPLSRETYGSLIPLLKKNVEGMKVKKGVDYLMRFTRYAFLYEDDQENFGKEKRLSAEETLFSKYSDCDDRAALFFYLVKEIYDLPMIALLYPTHITMAVQFEKPVGKNAILYDGRYYTVCEPTMQKQDLPMGKLSTALKSQSYKVVYSYVPPQVKE